LAISLKVAAFLLASVQFVGFGWWDRSDLMWHESAYWLAPGFALLAVAVIPFRLLDSVPLLRWALSALVLVALIRLASGAMAAWNAPIEPDRGAVGFQLLSLLVLAVSMVAVWARLRDKDQSRGG
jgi:hypothetical protein